MESTAKQAKNDPPCHVLEARISAPILLRLIRDGRAQTFPELMEQIGFDGSKLRLKNLLEQKLAKMQADGTIEHDSSSGRYTVTKHWIDLEALMGINLSALIERGQPGAMSVIPYFGSPRILDGSPDVFVLMPFKPELKPVYKDHLLPAIEKLGLTIKRADDFFTNNNVMDDIWAAICAARVLIADCTDRNPNVFYEIGLAHAIGKPVVLTTQRAEDVPFDLQSIRYIRYAFTPRGMDDFEKTVTETVRNTLQPEDSL